MFKQGNILDAYILDWYINVKLKLIEERDDGGWLAESPIGEIELSPDDLGFMARGVPLAIINWYDDEGLGALFVKYDGDVKECIHMINDKCKQTYRLLNKEEISQQIRDYFEKRNGVMNKFCDDKDIKAIKNMGINNTLYYNISKLLLDGIDPSDIIVYIRRVEETEAAVAAKRGKIPRGMREQDKMGNLIEFTDILRMTT